LAISPFGYLAGVCRATRSCGHRDEVFPVRTEADAHNSLPTSSGDSQADPRLAGQQIATGNPTRDCPDEAKDYKT
jgi:hypothetical protein